jgi:hypothetical protein
MSLGTKRSVLTQKLVSPPGDGEIGHQRTTELVYRPSVHQRESGIDAFYGTSISADNGNTPAGMLEDPGPSLQLPAGFHPLSDIPANTHNPRYYASGISQGREGGLHVMHRPLGL